MVGHSFTDLAHLVGPHYSKPLHCFNGRQVWMTQFVGKLSLFKNVHLSYVRAIAIIFAVFFVFYLREIYFPFKSLSGISRYARLGDRSTSICNKMRANFVFSCELLMGQKRVDEWEDIIIKNYGVVTCENTDNK